MIKVGNNYYFSSYGNGIIKTDTSFKIKQIYSTATGLSDNGVYRILNSGDSVLMVSTNNGINLINISNNKIRKLYKEDGLHSDAFEEFSSFRDGDKCYFGGNGGVTAIDIRKLRFDGSKITFILLIIK